MICPKCAFPNDDGVRVCRKCGEQLMPDGPAVSTTEAPAAGRQDDVGLPGEFDMPTPDENEPQADQELPQTVEKAENTADRMVEECLERARRLQEQGNLKGAFLACQSLLIERYEQIPKDRLADMYNYMADISELQDNRQRAERYRQKAASLVAGRQDGAGAAAAKLSTPLPAAAPAKKANTRPQGTAVPAVSEAPRAVEGRQVAGKVVAKEAERPCPAEEPSSTALTAAPSSLLVARFWRRLLAGIVDLAFIVAATLLSVLLSALVKGDGVAAAFGFFTERLSLLLLLFAMVFVFWLVYVTIFCVFGGQTAGQMLLGLKVVDRFGHTPGWKVAFVRMVGLGMSFLVGCAGFVWIAFDAERRGWHDRLANTVVISLAGASSTAGAAGGGEDG
ncbi:MAG: hypothetical protein D6806_03775 [Deltaproteobacteria bacterium]|nr:MAG: hypothetical protein D6806_03775 [Deltaproteobacteria bacterium]